MTVWPISHSLDALAHDLFAVAFREQREGELLAALFDGGSASLDRDGHLVIVTAAQLDAIAVNVGVPGWTR